MTIVREGVSTWEATGTHTTIDEEHTVQSGTTLSLLTVHTRGHIDVTELPSWNGTEDFTLIRELVTTGRGDDGHVYIYGLVSPTAATADIDYTIDSYNSIAHVLTNYSGTISSSVAAATTFLNEDDNTGPGTSGVHAEAGTTGATLFVACTQAANAGDPMTNDAGFFEIAEGDTVANVFYVIDLIGGAPSAVNITYSFSDQNQSIMIEILPAVAASGRLLLLTPHTIGQGL